MTCRHPMRRYAWPPPTGAMGPDSPAATARGFAARCRGAKRPLPGAPTVGHAARTPVCVPAPSLPELWCRHAHRRLHYRGRPGAADSQARRRAGRAAAHQPGPRAARLGRPTGRSRSGLVAPLAQPSPKYVFNQEVHFPSLSIMRFPLAWKSLPGGLPRPERLF